MLSTPPSFRPGAFFFAVELDGYFNVDERRIGHPQEIDMHRNVGHRVIMNITRQDLFLSTSPKSMSSKRLVKPPFSISDTNCDAQS